MTRIVEGSSYEPEFRKRSVKGVSFFIHDGLLDLITDHGDEGLLQDSEVMGLIVGRSFVDEEGEYVIAKGIISSKLEADSTSVRFDQSDMTQLIDAIDVLEEGDRIIGWYHSHLGYGCYMSKIDISTQDGIFGGNLGFAMVIDPVLRQLRLFDSKVGDPQQVQMIVME